MECMNISFERVGTIVECLNMSVSVFSIVWSSCRVVLSVRTLTNNVEFKNSSLNCMECVDSIM